MNSYQRSISIRTSPERLFDFHLDTANLKRISPPWFRTKLILDEGSGPDRILEYRVSVFYVPTHWHVEISEFNRPLVLSDLATKGPFRHFHHRRTFIQDGDMTVMTDHVEYELPLGLLGRLFDAAVVRQIISSMFRYRHRRTKELLEHAA